MKSSLWSLAISLLSALQLVLSAPPPAHLPSPINASTTPTASNDEPVVLCLGTDTPEAFSVDLEDCETVLDLILHDETGVWNLQQFSPRSRPGVHHVPTDWHHERCQVMINADSADAVDSFRLLDVMIKAQLIIEKCAMTSKQNLGGVTTVGYTGQFIVAVNGPEGDGPGRLPWMMNTTQPLQLNGHANGSSNLLDPSLQST